MLVRAVCYRSIPLDTLVDKALSGGIKGIQAVSPPADPSAAVSTRDALTSPLSCSSDHHAAT
jgi:PTS system ascorbate-specific IIA component